MCHNSFELFVLVWINSLPFQLQRNEWPLGRMLSTHLFDLPLTAT